MFSLNRAVYEIMRKKASNALLRFQYDHGYANAPTVTRKLRVLFLLFLEFGDVTYYTITIRRLPPPPPPAPSDTIATSDLKAIAYWFVNVCNLGRTTAQDVEFTFSSTRVRFTI